MISDGRLPRRLALSVGAPVLTVLIPLATFLVASWMLGWRLQLVKSGSMEPTYPVGSLTVVEPVQASDVRVGTVITFADPLVQGHLVTHRVTGILRRDDGLYFETRGDANLSPDVAPVPMRAVRGYVRWHVPYLGAVIEWLQWPRGFLILVVGPAVLLLGSALVRRIGYRPRHAPRRPRNARVEYQPRHAPIRANGRRLAAA